METVNPSDFEFFASAYANPPSTPKLMPTHYFSTHPDNQSDNHFYAEFEKLFISDEIAGHRSNSLATVPFAWEEKPGVPKSFVNVNSIDDDQDFAFDVTGRHSSVSSADDLFHGGVIKPVEIKGSRGRERTGTGLSSSRSRRTRSLPPFRGSELQSLQELQSQQSLPPVNMNMNTDMDTNVNAKSAMTLSTYGSGKWSRKWSFKDLFLFRSASEGRATDRDPLKKYSSIFRRKQDEDFRNLSMSRDGSGSKKKGQGQGQGRVSAHELHYKVNRAVSNDMKKKTFLPYKQGILGRLAFNPTVQALSNGFGNSHN